MRVLERKTCSGFASELTEYLRDRHGEALVRLPDEVLTVGTVEKAKLEWLVLGGIQRGSGYGLRWRSALAAFVVTMFLVAPNFDADLGVRNLLMDADIDPNHRMDFVRRQMTEERWNSIRSKYDAQAWSWTS